MPRRTILIAPLSPPSLYFVYLQSGVAERSTVTRVIEIPLHEVLSRRTIQPFTALVGVPGAKGIMCASLAHQEVKLYTAKRCSNSQYHLRRHYMMQLNGSSLYDAA